MKNPIATFLVWFCMLTLVFSQKRPGLTIPAAQKTPNISRGNVLLKLPFHTYYREIAYQIQEGRVIYDGDIDLGSEKEVLDRSEKNRNAFETGIQDINLLKLKERSKFPKLLERFNKGYNPQSPVHRKTPQQRSAILLDPEKLWVGGRVPYLIKINDFPPDFRDDIQLAMDAIEQNTTLEFISRTDEQDHIQFIKRNKGIGSSPVGRQGGRQRIRLNPENARVGNIIHEIMHSLGFYHLHSRADRDQYICIDFDNIEGGENNINFDRHDGEELTGVYGRYNVNSIMQYSTCAFSTCGLECADDINTCATILAKNTAGTCSVEIDANRSNPPQSDWDAINYLYANVPPGNLQIGGSGSGQTITLTIERVVTIRGPEENGVGCNDKMDYFGEVEVGILDNIQEDPYRFRETYPFTLNKVEGNDIRPSNWRANFFLPEGEEFGMIRINLMDEDKAGPGGIGACGGADDYIDIDPLSGDILQLVVQPSRNRIHLSQNSGNITTMVTPTEMHSTLNGVLGSFGQTIEVKGNRTSPHVAKIYFRVDKE